MKYVKLFFIVFIFFGLLFAGEDPMQSMTIEYGGYDLTQTEVSSSKQTYVPQAYYDNVILVVQEAHLLARKGEHAAAAAKFKQALKTDSTYVFALNGLGNAYLKLNDLANAERYFRQAMLFGESYAFPYNNLANLYILQGKHDDAVPLLQKALKYDPNSAYVYYNLGNVYLAKEKYNLAQSHYLKAIKYDKNFCNARYNLALTYQRQNREGDALKEYEAVVKICPGHKKAVLNLAAYYLQSGKADQAILLYRQALLINPQAELYLALGHAYHNQGFAKLEIGAYEEAVKLDSSDVEARYFLALSYYEQNMKFSSLKLCRDILEDDPENTQALDLLEKIGL